MVQNCAVIVKERLKVRERTAVGNEAKRALD